ncbi:MAG: TOBE domain-containing protein, partial [Boseongicola sp.]
NMIDAETTENGLMLFNGATIEVSLENSTPGQQVTLGIRPEDFSVGGSTALIEGHVSVCEPLGAETLLHVALNGTEVIAKASGRIPPKVDEVVGLSVDPKTMHLFDRTTGRALPMKAT